MLNIDRIESFFDSSPAIRLFRAKSAPVILSFFYRTFKEKQAVALTEEEIIEELSDFLHDHQIEEDEENGGAQLLPDFETKARYLVNQWTEKGFLKNYENTENEILYELSLYAEKVIQWLEQLETKEFVGTESRFKDIFNKLRELVDNTTEDVGTKIRELEKQQQDIQKEIDAIKSSGKVSIYDDYQVKSRVIELTRTAKELLSDFKEVEDNFKVITRNIYQKHTDPEQTKGAILGYTFDSLDELKESDQGKSFYAFWEFLISQDKKDQWKDLVEKVFRVLETRSIHFDDVFLSKMKHYLFRAGQKVNDANDRMSEKLSRVISEKELAERVKVKESIKRIKELALMFIERDQIPSIGIEIEVNNSLTMPLEKKLNLTPTENPVFNHRPTTASLDEDQIEMDELFSLFAIDKTLLNERIQEMLKEKSQVSLKDLLDRYPLDKGLSELLAYFSLVENNEHFMFSPDKEEIIRFDSGKHKYIKIPQLIFTR